MYYNCHKVTFRCSGSYFDSPDWIKKRKVIINKSNNKSENNWW